jgi:hypothetical protein
MMAASARSSSADAPEQHGPEHLVEAFRDGHLGAFGREVKIDRRKQ